MSRVAGLLLVVFLLCLAGCGETKPDNNSNNGNNNNNSNSCPPSAAPPPIDIYSYDGALRIEFTAIPVITMVEKYDLWFGTNPNREGSGNTNRKDVLKRDVTDTGDPKGPVYGRIEGLTNDTKYYIWINAEYESNCKSAYTSATGTPVPLPAIPTSVAVTAGDESIDVEWPEVKYASSYTVAYNTRNNISGATVIENITEPGYILSGLTNGTPYYVWVSAKNYNGSTQYSEQREPAKPVPATESPDSPGALTVERGTKSLKVTWNAVLGAKYYELYHSASNQSSLITEDPIRVDIASGRVSTSIPNLENGKTYYAWVKAVNRVGSSDFSQQQQGVPSKKTGINLGNPDFVLGVQAKEYIFGEDMPPLSPLSRTGDSNFQDNLHRAKETPIGNLFTDSAQWYLNVFSEPGKEVDFVFLNTGYITAAMPSQVTDVTVRDIMRVVGNSMDKIVILTMKGSDVKALFEYAATHAPHLGFRGNHSEGPGGQLFRSSGAWPIVSKELNYTIKYPFVTREVMNMGAKLGSSNPVVPPFFFGNIESGTLKLNGAIINDNDDYRVATTNYNVDELYTEPMLKASKEEDTGINYWHAVAEYIYDAETITPAIDGRIRIKGGVIGGPFGVAEGYNQYCPADAAYDEVRGCIFK
jgi:hypothetical protein